VQRSSLHIKKTLSDAFPSIPSAKALSPNMLLSLCRYIVVLFPINGLLDYIVILETLKVEY